MGLTAIPAAAWAITDLVRLDLSNNDLDRVPPELGRLTALKELWLNGNLRLSVIPAEVELCTQLRFVDLRDTNITDLPKEISRLPRLSDVALSQNSLTPRLAVAYSGGTRSLLQHLAYKDTQRKLAEQLRRKLDVEVYREISGTEHGAALISALVQQVLDTFTDLEELRQVARNAERLFPADVEVADAGAIQKRMRLLAIENQKKKLAADVELKLRALYFDRLRVERVEGMVKSIYEHVTELKDIKFMLHFAPVLFPDDPNDLSGDKLLAAIRALRKKRAEDREAAIAQLTKALVAMYADREPEELQAVATTVAKLLKGAVDDIKALSSDVAVHFPTEFSSARPHRVVRSFLAEKAD